MLRRLLFIGCIVLISASRLHLERKPSSRIVNGVEATPGEFPWMVTMLVDSYHLCGGAVIANGWVVTAAHCVYAQNITSLSVVTDLHDFNNPGNYEWYYVQQVIMHPNFNEGDGAYPNDVALLGLYLDGRDTSRNIITVADGSNSFVGETCTLSGWGITETGSGSNQLRKADVVALSQSECIDYWGAGNILDQQICVKGYQSADGAGACNYDNGGPLVCSEVLAGIISWGDSGCNTEGAVSRATVCASMGYFYTWMNSACNNCL